jgi:hypothetical protein
MAAQRRRAGAAGRSLHPTYAHCQVTDQLREVTLW